MYRLLLSVLVLPFSLLLFSSCSSAPRKSAHLPWKDRIPRSKNYKPITKHKLVLQPVTSRRLFFAGEEVEFSFRLLNNGREISVPEWFQDQDANLLLYYRPYTPDIKEFDEKDWQCLKKEITLPARRFCLVLNNGNSVLLPVKLDFIKDMAAPKKPVKYILIAKLNLKSLPLKSQGIIIEIK